MLPRHLLDYRISASSKTEDLLTLGRLFSEVGEYASTIQQRAYTDTARMCRTRFRKIERELLRRSAIRTADDIFLPPPPSSLPSDLTSLSISELEILYRQRLYRTEARIAEGREHLTLFFEARIIAELSRRTPDSLTDRFRIDYCLLTYRNELANLSSIFNLPLGDPKDCLPFDLTHTYTSAELIALLTLYQSPRTLTEREILIETVDYSLNLLSAASPDALQSLANLTAHLAELRRRKTVRCPIWIDQSLSEAIQRWNSLPQVRAAEMIYPLLTYAFIKKDWSMERKAQHLINQHYKACREGNYNIEDLYVAVTYCSYISRFSICNIARIWNNYCEMLISSNTISGLYSESIIGLLEVAKDTEEFSQISYFLKSKLIQILRNRAKANDVLAQIHLRIILIDCKYKIAEAV